METITISIKSDLIPEFVQFIEKFGVDKMKIIDRNNFINTSQEEFKQELSNYENGFVNCFSIDEFENILNQIIEKYEN